ncbi:NAD(P)-dependent dehydrogenase [Commensalibacter communis]|uniref:Short-chain alcohol dehydrogenase family (FabG) n=1 Tax=Commensalibacter communis TaxID=2972786 RepID=A0A9W4TP26_9PROT|nr:SDR family oxidoreductase [Commensalibacter communis]CAI3922582.1 NAD(P)-dependent dehydrogenase [Commensalibacter communis]CAI3944180.1 NAD(P)-dependent dehydrogenase [Commensalibacter communis]CAI3950333.1 NAD(P)-dependent dehydrogenase [Commensalibacter communis]CAI3951990.1 NAD(P)-dependent dehydrogenase [Commensalibacter communis]
MELFSLFGQNAFVTGAGSGIGQKIALYLAKAGVNVGCFDLPNSAGLADTAEQVKKLGRQSIILTGDVTKPDDLEKSVNQVETELGNLSLAVNCAGIANANPAEEMSIEQWQRLYDINVKGLFLSCQAEARLMLKHGRGSIVNIASMSGVIVNRGLMQAHYNSAKAAVIHMTKSMAVEWAERGVRVNAISPGYTATPMNTRPEMVDQMKQFASETPMQRIAEPDEMAGPAIFLLSEAASFCTGVNLLVDGGFCCW